ncbi:hypothetical protein MFIFM68171_05544 [Madurella fahalii]|uniref:PLL-like beta propeller domain-containing protein n=1 Tax=Madurella fahalii TaxID=1157608 RepID=A0ABQ0GC84_9PEZI
MHTALVVLLAGVGSVLCVPPHGLGQAFRPEPRSAHLDWNTPRPDYGGFLAKRADVHSEEFFNSPPTKRSPLASDNVSAPLHALAGRAMPGQWENLEGSAMWHPAPVSWGGPRLDVYYMDKDRKCKHKSYEGRWSPWEDLGGSLDSAPACCSRKRNNMHVFCKGTDGQAWHRTYNTGGWGSWQGMGGNMKHYPSACSWGDKHVGVYVSANDGQCWHRRYDEDRGGWYDWENMGGYLDGPPKAVTWGSGHTSVYCRGEDGQAWHKKYENSAWGDWESLGGSVDGEPAACAWDGRMDVFVKGTDGACWHKTYKKGSGWGGWQNLGGKLKKAPDVVAYKGKMELYITGDDNAVYRRVWENDRWTPTWEHMGGNVDTKPSAVTWDDGKVDVYGTGPDGTCRRCY